MRKSFLFIVILILAGVVLVIFLASCKSSSVFSDSSYEPMNDYMAHFNELFTRQPLDELNPITEIPAEDLSWLLKDEADVNLKASKGLKFANGDILIVFFYEADQTILLPVLNSFSQSPFNQGKGLQYCIKDDMGIIISSPDYGDILNKMSETAYYM